jgi:hypothetical protein
MPRLLLLAGDIENSQIATMETFMSELLAKSSGLSVSTPIVVDNARLPFEELRSLHGGSQKDTNEKYEWKGRKCNRSSRVQGCGLASRGRSRSRWDTTTKSNDIKLIRPERSNDPRLQDHQERSSDGSICSTKKQSNNFRRTKSGPTEEHKDEKPPLAGGRPSMPVRSTFNFGSSRLKPCKVSLCLSQNNKEPSHQIRSISPLRMNIFN